MKNAKTNKQSNTTTNSFPPSKKQQKLSIGQQKLDLFFKINQSQQNDQIQKKESRNATRDESKIIRDNLTVTPSSISTLDHLTNNKNIESSISENNSLTTTTTTKSAATTTNTTTSIDNVDINNFISTMGMNSTESTSLDSQSSLKPQNNDNNIKNKDIGMNTDNNTAATTTTVTATTTTATFFDNSMYTEQFHHMIDTVLDGESFLFTKEDLDRFETFKQLNLESQHLIVRLWMRKLKWIRLEKLDYSTTIRDLSQASKELKNHGLLYIEKETNDDENDDEVNKNSSSSNNNNNNHDSMVLTWDNMMTLINLDEIKDIAQIYHCEPESGKTKSDYIMALTKSYQQSMELRSVISSSKQNDPYIQKIKQILGPCIIMDKNYYALFQRLNIVYYRLRDPTETNSMRAAILSKISKRHYPDYIYCRTVNIWLSIEDLDQYVTAFYLQHDFEMKMENIIIERRIKNRKNKMKNENSTSNDDNDKQLWMDCWIMCENIVGHWEDLLQKRPISMDMDRPYFMRRFEAGWIYTHMIEHGTKALAKLQEYSLEAVILQKLIDQQIYRMGKRGKWYDRLALVQANYLKDIPERKRKKMALQTCIKGIQDPRVHQIYINNLQKRIQRLERDLCIPKREQHDFSYMTLKKPSEKIIHGERISDSITGKKSSWRGDDGAEVSVEEVSIQYYNKIGYQGLHTENGVVTMLFMLLFWDVIFSPLPGVFETPFQTAPLDLGTDAFYVGRIGMINERINQIGKKGSDYLDIIRRVYEQHSPLQTMCAGINWNYKLEDLLEVAECIGPEPLSSLCRLLAEEYGYRLGKVNIKIKIIKKYLMIIKIIKRIIRWNAGFMLLEL
ncbi:unnamed protein product [Cunninghamella echinulata]